MSVSLMMQDYSGKGSETLTPEKTEILNAILAEIKKINGKLDIQSMQLEQIANR
jgi:hypothetical protein